MPRTNGDFATLTIAVPTYRRPLELAALATQIAAQMDDLEQDVRVRVVVIDNDSELSASHIISSRRDGRFQYVHESRPGVAAVRNRALQLAWTDDMLIFIDDDQLPGPEWLKSMISSWRSGADAVAGPVESELPVGADEWICKGGFFDRSYRKGLRTGDRIDEVATTNLLLDMQAVRDRDLHFDERFGLSGGEDSLFTRTLTSSGASIVWSTSARVIELVPPNRATRSWVCRRAVSSGNGAARVRLALTETTADRGRVRAELLASGFARCGAGAGGFLLGLLTRSAARQGRSVRTMMRGLGMCLGSLGVSYLEYARSGRRLQRV